MNARQQVVFEAPAVPAPAQRSFDINGTLQFVHQAAETIRQLQKDNDESMARAIALKSKIAAEQSERQAEVANYESTVAGLTQKLTEAKTLAADAQAIARAAVARFEKSRGLERAAIERAEAAEARARELEGWLERIQETMVSEFSQLMAPERP